MAQQRELLGEEGVRVKACVEHAVEVSVTACALPEDNCSMLFGRHWALMTPGSSKLTLTFSLNQGCVPTLQIDAVSAMSLPSLSVCFWQLLLRGVMLIAAQLSRPCS